MRLLVGGWSSSSGARTIAELWRSASNRRLHLSPSAWLVAKSDSGTAIQPAVVSGGLNLDVARFLPVAGRNSFPTSPGLPQNAFLYDPY